MTYAADSLYREVAYVAFHFHWALDDILGMAHHQRRRFVAEIGHINTRIARGD